MHIRIRERIAEAIGKEKFVPFGVNKDSWAWKSGTTLNLARYDKDDIKKLRKLFEQHTDIHGVGGLLKDVDVWIEATSDAAGAKARTVISFAGLLKNFLQKVSGHRIYKKIDDEGTAMFSFYVSYIKYEPRVVDRGYVTPEHVVMSFAYEEFGGRQKDSVVFHDNDCRGMTVVEALARQGYYPETKAMRANYIAEVMRFKEITPCIGKQFLAVGTATDNLDGNKDSDDDSWYRHSVHTIYMERGGAPTRVVIDVFQESQTRERDREDKPIDTTFWKRQSENDPEDEGDESDDDTARVEIEIPIHPLLAVFDLSKHLRLRIHVNYVTEYVYDKQLISKLILPAEQKSLVRMLVEHKGTGFQDIVRGKGGGAVVLLTGPPGTGKTLTAEVFAESEERALYSVQCSQLGTDPNVLEDELLKVFARSRRWNAVMLLDEADVYVHERGSDLQQNAIVGVFLRVLEYQDSVLFLTTNRPGDVDDAIASRCIARLDYTPPCVADQKEIWKVLAANSGINLKSLTVDRVVKSNPTLTGRDVKNLLKLAQLISASTGKAITSQTIEFVKRFKPTNTVGA